VTIATRRLRFVAPMRSRTPDHELSGDIAFLPMDAIGDDGTFDRESTRPAEEITGQGYTYFRQGDVVRARVTPCFENGKGALLSDLQAGEGLGTTELFVFKPGPDVDPRYLYYVTASSDFTEQGTATMYGAHGVRRVDETFARNYRMWLPTLDEQRAIADYLDRETARIDALIDAKQRMLSLLDEKWRAMLDAVIWSSASASTALMHLVDPTRQVMYGIVLPGPDVDPEGVAIVKGGDVAQGRLSWDQLCKTTEAIEAPFARARLRGGDIVFAIRGGIGDVAMVPDGITGANITQDVARIAPRPGVDAKWLMYALQSPTAQSDARRRVTGATITGLNIWELDRIRVPSKTTAQQLRERDRLNGWSARIHGGQMALGAQRDLLKERRRALITAAVTGQIEVPVAA
jgi:type I restriction enzyme S subunit